MGGRSRGVRTKKLYGESLQSHLILVPTRLYTLHHFVQEAITTNSNYPVIRRKVASVLLQPAMSGEQKRVGLMYSQSRFYSRPFSPLSRVACMGCHK